jgi:hypothetical protein
VGSQVSGLADQRIGSLEPVHSDHNPRGMNVEFLSQGTNPLFEGLRQTQGSPVSCMWWLG